MFLAVRYLLDRLCGPRSRADELLALRRRLTEQDACKTAGETEKRLARRLCELREQLAARLGQVEACARCGETPTTLWRGGQCCSARTHELFSDPELTALRLTGTKPSDLTHACGEHAGCAFREPTGCSLPVRNRPSVCVGYACRELLVELRRRGDAAVIARLQDELQGVFQRFLSERAARLEANLFEELEAGCLLARR